MVDYVETAMTDIEADRLNKMCVALEVIEATLNEQIKDKIKNKENIEEIPIFFIGTPQGFYEIKGILNKDIEADKG